MPDQQQQIGYIAPRPVRKGFLSIGRKQAESAVFKGDDGSRYMFIITSNGYQDRDAETIHTKALADYVRQSWPAEDKCITNNKHQFWHEIDIGDIVFCDMAGTFLWEVSKELPGTFTYDGQQYPIAAIWDYIEQHPEEQWGASHGFKYLSPDRVDREYEWINKFETSSLPLRYAANPYTFSGVIDMTPRNAFLDKMLGRDGAAEALRKAPLALETALTDAGVTHKAMMPPQATAGDATPTAASQEPTPDADHPDQAAMITAGVMEVINANNGTSTDIKQVEAAILAKVQEMLGMQAAQPSPPAAPAAKALATDTLGRVDVMDALKALTAFNNDLVETQGQLAGELGNIAKALNAIMPVVQTAATLPAAITSIGTRLEDIEKQVSGRPRIASQDKATQVDPATLPPSIAKSMEDYTKTWMNLPVREIPK